MAYNAADFKDATDFALNGPAVKCSIRTAQLELLAKAAHAAQGHAVFFTTVELQTLKDLKGVLMDVVSDPSVEDRSMLFGIAL